MYITLHLVGMNLVGMNLGSAYVQSGAQSSHQIDALGGQERTK